MAAKPFTREEWRKIRGRLADDPDHFGLPARVYGSVLLGSFNNRSLVRRTEIATDVTYDRSKLINTLADHPAAIHEATAPYAKKRREYRDRLARFEHKVSDHMPLWLRLPLP